MEAPEQPKQVGRPSEYDKAMCDKVIKMGQQGLLIAEMAAGLGIAKSTLYEWVETNKEFSDAYHIARTHAQAFWEKEQRKAALYEDEIPLYRGKSLEFLVSRAFREDWGDKQEVLHSGSVEGLTIEFVNARHIAAEDEG